MKTEAKLPALACEEDHRQEPQARWREQFSSAGFFVYRSGNQSPVNIEIHHFSPPEAPMNPLPTVSQVREVKHLADLFVPATVVRLTGAPFRIAQITNGIKIADDGTVANGQHRLSALFQLATQ